MILIGNLGKDPEVRHLDSNTAVANFPVATSESYTNREGQRVEQTEWHNVVLWRKLAEIAGKYLKKGSKVYIEGSLQTRSWDDKDGNKRYTTEIVGRNMQMLDRPDGESGSPESGREQKSAPKPEYSGGSSGSSGSADMTFDESGDDDLPF